MSDLADEYPGIIFLAIVFLMMLYGCSGGLRAYCKWQKIEVEDRRVQFWIASVVLVFLVVLGTAVLVFSGLFMNLIELVSLFSFAYVFTLLLMGALSSTNRNIRKM